MKKNYSFLFENWWCKTLFAVIFFIGTSFHLFSQTIIVNSTEDGDATTVQTLAASGTITLRYALQYATRDIVKFDNSLAGQTININQGSTFITIEKSVILDGETNNITINGGGANRLLYVNDNINTTSTAAIVVLIKNLTFKNGNGFKGGAIRNLENLTVENCVFEGNTVSHATDTQIVGGALAMHKVSTTDAQLHVKYCLFKNNSVPAQGMGGGAISTLNDGTGTAKLIVENSVFIGNTAGTNGGAIAVLSYGVLTAFNNTFINNNASSDGGAIYHNNATTTLGGNLFLSNTKGTSVYNDIHGRASYQSGPFTSLGYNVYQSDITTDITQSGYAGFLMTNNDKKTGIPNDILALDDTAKGGYLLTAGGNVETRIVPQSFVNTNGLVTDIAGTSRTGSSFYNAGAKNYPVTTGFTGKTLDLVQNYFPNPVKNILYFKVKESVELLNYNGIVMYKGQNVTSIDMSNLPAGLYMLRTKNGNIEKIIKAN